MASHQNNFIINKTYDSSIFRTIVKRYWWAPIVFIGFMLLMAFIYLRYTKPVYESNLILQLSNEDNGREILDIENLSSKKNDYYSQIELIRSQLLFEKAITSLNLNVSLFSRGEILTEEKYKSCSFNIIPYALHDSSLVNEEIKIDFDGNFVKLNYKFKNKDKTLKGKIGAHLVNEDFDIVVKSNDINDFKNVALINELYFTFNSIGDLSNRLISGLIVEPIDESAKTIKIGYRSHNAEMAKDVIMSVATTFISYFDYEKKRSAENILRFINVQLDSLSSELKRSKDSLMDYQRSENLPDPESVGISLKSNVDLLQEQLFLLDDEIATLNAINTKLSESPNRLEVYRLLPELMGKSYEVSIASHIELLHQMMEEKEDLLFRLTEESAEIKRLDKRIQEKIRLIIRSINAIENRLMTKAKVLRTKVMSLEGEYINLPEKKMEFYRLKNIQDLNEKYFQLLTEKKVLYAISDAGYSSNNRILTKSELNTRPVAPNRNLIYGSFFFFGLTIGLVIMFVKYVSFNEINQLEDLESILPSKATILGGVPLFQHSLEYSQLIVTDAPKSIMAESMRKIRVNLSYIKPDFQTIAISSSISGEGKTFVALNLAGIIAMSGKKTIIIDLDMRKPKIHLGFGVQNIHGMSGLIVGQSSLEQCIHKNVAENLDFITAGPIPPNPSELLLSERFMSIIDELKSFYDVIIIDNPPVGIVSDGVKILTDADIPIYVFKSHYSKRNFALRIKELFDVQQLSSLNVILNGIQKDNKSIYSYGYNYGSGYVDQDDNAKFNKPKGLFEFLKKWFKRNGSN